VASAGAGAAARHSSPPFARQVDDYLEQFARFHPSIAAGNGIHSHDGELEDYSGASISAELHWLHASKARLRALDKKSLTADERVDARILEGIIDGWLLDLDTVHTWTRNPMIYVVAISDGLHDLATMKTSAPEVRMRQAILKLEALPRLLAAARTNVRNPPKVYVERAVAMLGGVDELLSKDLALAFADSKDSSLQEQLQRRANEARGQLTSYRQELESQVLPTAHGDFAVGVKNVEARYRAEELIDLPAGKLLEIGERELAAKRAEFAATAARVDGKSAPAAVWQTVQSDHPARGAVVAAATDILNQLFAFIRTHDLMDLPRDEHIIVAPAPAYDLGLASMHSSPPLEPHPVQSYYYITDAQADWSPERQAAWLSNLNYATLGDITAHEVAPGHFVHSIYMRRTPGKIRRIWIGLNPFPQPSSGQDGWAHYAEQMVSDEGFKSDDPRYRLAQINESIKRICRLIAGIKLNSGEWTVAQASALFVEEAHVPAEVAEREAIRGTYDPTYGGYFLGKLAAFKLRRDYQTLRGAQYSLKEFHERVMTDGIAPWWAHRQLLLPGDHGEVVD
jgi:uncharacterized protein (DUF885 family)